MFTKENGKLALTVFVAALAAMAVHQKVVAPMLVKKTTVAAK